MPKITVYLPDDLATDVKAAGISVSPICQRALEEEVKRMALLRAWSGDERLAAARERLLATTAHDDLDQGRQQGREWALSVGRPERAAAHCIVGRGFGLVPRSILGRQAIREQGRVANCGGVALRPQHGVSRIPAMRTRS